RRRFGSGPCRFDCGTDRPRARIAVRIERMAESGNGFAALQPFRRDAGNVAGRVRLVEKTVDSGVPTPGSASPTRAPCGPQPPDRGALLSGCEDVPHRWPDIATHADSPDPIRRECGRGWRRRTASCAARRAGAASAALKYRAPAAILSGMPITVHLT